MSGQTKTITLKDIARDCGVSLSVVSRALNPHPDQLVSPRTKQRVEEAMRRLNYRRNNAASLLARGKDVTLGVFLPYYHEYLITELVVGISRAAAAHDFQCSFYFGMSQNNYLEFLRHINDIGSSGILTYPIAGPCSLEVGEAVSDFCQRGGCTVMLHKTTIPGIEHLQIDNQHGGMLAARRLKELECQRFIFLHHLNSSLPESISDYALARMNGFKAYLEKNGLTAEAKGVQTQGSSIYLPQDFSEMISDIRQGETTGFFAESDYMAFALVQELNVHGLNSRIGHDIFVIGYDDNPITLLAKPQITSIHQHFCELGQQGMELLISKIMGTEYKPQIPLPSLVVRNSA